MNTTIDERTKFEDFEYTMEDEAWVGMFADLRALACWNAAQSAAAALEAQAKKIRAEVKQFREMRDGHTRKIAVAEKEVAEMRKKHAEAIARKEANPMIDYSDYYDHKLMALECGEAATHLRNAKADVDTDNRRIAEREALAEKVEGFASTLRGRSQPATPAWWPRA